MKQKKTSNPYRNIQFSSTAILPSPSTAHNTLFKAHSRRIDPWRLTTTQFRSTESGKGEVNLHVNECTAFTNMRSLRRLSWILYRSRRFSSSAEL